MKAKKSKIIGMVIVLLCSMPLVLYADTTEEEVVNTVTTTEVSTRDDSLDSLVLIDMGATVTVTGYDYTKNPLGTSVVIPSHNAAGKAITVIGDSAFLGNKTIKEVVLSEIITTISNKAFESSSLSKINLPSGVSIGSYAFSKTKITDISIPGNATIVGATYAFDGCPKLVNVVIEEGIIGIPERMFSFCTALKKVTLPSTIKSIGEAAFRGNPKNLSLEEINLPPSLTEIGEYAFFGTNLSNVDIPGSIGTLKNNVFEYCHFLTEVTIGEGVTVIDEYAFNYCPKLEKVTIPSTVTSIGKWAFSSTKSLKQITLPSGLQQLGEWVFEHSGLTSIEIPQGITTIPRCCFYFNRSLTSVTLPEGLTTISASAFYHCDALETINIPSTVTSIGNGAFSSTKSLRQITLPSGIPALGSSEFAWSGLTSIEIPPGITTIPEHCFLYSKSLTSVTLPEGLTTIDSWAFRETSLLYIDIPSTVTSVANDAFLSQKVTGEIIYKDGKYMYPLPKEMNMDKMTVKTDGVVLDIVNKRLVMDSALETVVYDYAVSNATHTFTPMDVTLTLSLKESTVTFKDDVGTVLDTVLVGSGQAGSTTVVPFKEGYTFIGWDKDISCVIEDMVVTAIFKELPIVTTKEAFVKVNSKFDPLTYIKAIDAEGKRITEITIINSTVDMTIEGIYVVEFEVVDQWGGKVVSSLQVEVYKDLEYRTIIDPLSGIKVGGYLHQEARLIVEYLEIEKNELNTNIKDQLVVGSYEARIEGKYVGKLILTFPIDIKYEGEEVYIKHLKHNGEVESFTRTCKDGQVSIEVKELSPFMVSVEKDLEYRTIIDPLSGIKVGGYLYQEARLIVEYLEIEKNELNTNIEDQLVVGSYEARIEGKYVGKLTITFPIDIKYEGEEVYIKHLRHNGEVESFTRTCKDGQVSIEVKELSPFMVSVEKEEESLVTMTKNPTTPLHTGNPMKPLNTGNQSEEDIYLSVLVITSIVFIIVVRKRRKQEQ